MWRTTKLGLHIAIVKRISIHVLRVEDDLLHGKPKAGAPISIHVLRVEDDWVEEGRKEGLKISIHVLRVEDDCTMRA